MDPRNTAPPLNLMPLEQDRARMMFLDCIVYQDKSPQSNNTWIGAETSCGHNFYISLRIQPPPAFSTLHLWTDDAVADDAKKRISAAAVASCRDAILMHTSVKTGTYPRFRHEYYLLTNGAMLRLPPMPGPHEINIGILRHHQGGCHGGGDDQYTVAVLKEGGSSLTPDPVQPPYVCIYSTSTNQWTSRPVSVPACCNNWDFDMVLADGTTFWWVDLHCGILSYDVMVDHNHNQQQSTAAVLGFIPLPPCIQPDRDEREYHLRQDRCVGVSAGELRCVHVFEDRVKTWSWRSGRKEWVDEYEMKLADFWEHKGYSESGLPRSAPEYPTVDPSQPNVVNFFMLTGKCYSGCVIGVDLLSMEVIHRGQFRKGLLNMVRGLEIVELSSATCTYI